MENFSFCNRITRINKFSNLVFLIFLLFFVYIPNILFCKQIYVPDDYQSIQSAIDNSNHGDTVIIRNGTYSGEGNFNINFNSKRITVQSESNYQNCIVDCQNSGRGFIFNSGEDNSSVLKGLTILDGRSNDAGGGIYCESSSPIINNCKIHSCSIGDDSVTSNNFGGAGISCINSSPQILNCVISDNVLYAYKDGGGGIYCYGSSSPLIYKCLIENNFASASFYDEGGGIFCDDNSSPQISSCTFINNKARTGGAISIYSSSPIIQNCIINNNQSVNSAAAILIRLSSPKIFNCTIVNNRSEDRSGGIQTLSNYSNVKPIIVNTILWGNFPDQLFITASVAYNLKVNPDIKNSLIQGGFSGVNNYKGTDIITSNPSFVDSANNDFSLDSNSPCIDAGTYENAPNVDIEGTYRPQGPSMDIGAYEYYKGDTNNGSNFNATGTWYYTTSNVQNNCPGETAQPETGELIITQNSNNTVVLTNNNRDFSGTVNATVYNVSDSDMFNDGSRIDNINFQLISETILSGTYSGSWTDGSLSCQWSGSISANKTSEGGSNNNNNDGDGSSSGGCFISTITKQ